MARRIKKQEYIKAVKDAKGFISHAAAKLNCQRAAIYEAAKRYPEVQEAIDEAREGMTDFAESKLYKKIADEDTASIIFYLKTQGKRRGYIERQEIDANVRGNIVIDLVDVPNRESDS